MIRTFSFTRGDVDLVIPCTVVRYPLDAWGKSVDDLSVEDADVICRHVVSVQTHDAFVLASRLQVGEEISSIGRVHHLAIPSASRQNTDRQNYTDDDVCDSFKHLFTLLVSPHEVPCE